MLASKYGLAVRNLQAKDVETVEVLEHHEAIKALKNVRFNEAAALNIKLKDSSKARLLGVGDAGLGTGHSPVLWQGRLQGMLFSKGVQNFSIYKGNNTGVNVSDELGPLVTDPFALDDRSHASGLLSSLRVGHPGLDESRYLQNSSHLLSVNQLWKKSDERQWRFQLSYINNRITEAADYRTDYFLGQDSLISVPEYYRTKEKEHSLDGELSFEQNTDSCFVKNILSFKGKFRTDRASVGTDPGNRSLRLRSPSFAVSDRFSFIKNLQTRVFQIYSFNQWVNTPQRLWVQPDRPDTLFVVFPYEKLDQGATLSTFQSRTFTSWRFRLAGFYVGAETGLHLQADHLHSDLDRFIGEKAIQMPDSFQNRFDYFRLLTYVEPNLSYTGLDGRLSASLRLNAGWLYRKQSAPFIFQPRLNLHYNVTSLWEVGMNISRSFRPDEINELYPGYIMTDYRSFQSFSSKYTSRYTEQYAFSTTYKNPMKGLFLALKGGISCSHESFVQRIRFDGIMRYNDRLPKKHTDKSKHLTFNMGKSFAFWNTRLSGEASYYNTEYLFDVSELSHYYLHNISFSSHINTQPFRFLNVEYKVSFANDKIQVEDADVSRPARTVNQLLAFHLFFSERWLVDFFNSFYREKYQEVVNSYFMDARFTYRFRNETELSLSASNLLNTHLYRIETIGSYNAVRQSCPLRGREICVNYSFSF